MEYCTILSAVRQLSPGTFEDFLSKNHIEQDRSDCANGICYEYVYLSHNAFLLQIGAGAPPPRHTPISYATDMHTFCTGKGFPTVQKRAA